MNKRLGFLLGLIFALIFVLCFSLKDTSVSAFSTEPVEIEIFNPVDKSSMNYVYSAPDGMLYSLYGTNMGVQLER